MARCLKRERKTTEKRGYIFQHLIYLHGLFEHLFFVSRYLSLRGLAPKVVGFMSDLKYTFILPLTFLHFRFLFLHFTNLPRQELLTQSATKFRRETFSFLATNIWRLKRMLRLRLCFSVSPCMLQSRIKNTGKIRTKLHCNTSAGKCHSDTSNFFLGMMLYGGILRFTRFYSLVPVVCRKARRHDSDFACPIRAFSHFGFPPLFPTLRSAIKRESYLTKSGGQQM